MGGLIPMHVCNLYIKEVISESRLDDEVTVLHLRIS